MQKCGVCPVYTVNMEETAPGLGSQWNQEWKKCMSVSDFLEEQVTMKQMEKGQAHRKNEKKIQSKE